MDKEDVLILAYQIATLTSPDPEVFELLLPLPLVRSLELLLLIRQSPKPVKSPINFLRRAIEDGWTSETIPQRIDRARQNHEEQFYINRGYTLAEAKRLATKKQY